ncbi:hypothetical protein [Spirosoma sp. KUDC1026]|uniref:hypothetical protein n=1 Tax=Spirosoma sp. KUDC1026 TaxID=2745947 RepID=UPI00159B9861|nr:hypothetical protein [Spirosoma sp. KUDC1026]QKZ14754.1 hypothetical protein HU175_19845 [Spirosoma sp. KUDC1026]
MTILRTGAQYRNIHPDWLPWQAVYYYLDQRKKAKFSERLNAVLNQLVVGTQERLWVADVDAANKADGGLVVP